MIENDAERREIERVAGGGVGFLERCAASAAGFKINPSVRIQAGTGAGVDDFNPVQAEAEPGGSGADGDGPAEDCGLGVSLGGGAGGGLNHAVVFALAQNDALRVRTSAILELLDEVHFVLTLSQGARGRMACARATGAEVLS